MAAFVGASSGRSASTATLASADGCVGAAVAVAATSGSGPGRLAVAASLATTALAATSTTADVQLTRLIVGRTDRAADPPALWASGLMASSCLGASLRERSSAPAVSAVPTTERPACSAYPLFSQTPRRQGQKAAERSSSAVCAPRAGAARGRRDDTGVFFGRASARAPPCQRQVVHSGPLTAAQPGQARESPWRGTPRRRPAAARQPPRRSRWRWPPPIPRAGPVANRLW